MKSALFEDGSEEEEEDVFGGGGESLQVRMQTLCSHACV